MQSDRTLTRQVDQLGRTRVDLNGRTGVDQLARTERATCAPSGWTSLAELQVDLIRRAVTFEGTMPRLVEELARMNELLARIAAQIEEKR